MKFPTPEAQCAEIVFQISPLFVQLTFPIIFQGQHERNWTWCDLWNLLTINFKDKFFHNYIDWARLDLQVYIPLSVYSLWKALF